MSAALLTSTSMRPYVSRVFATSVSQSAGSEMFTATGVASPSAARISATVVSSEPANWWSPSLSVRAAQTTLPPSAANSFAISAPMPRLAPVTMTTLSLSLPITFPPHELPVAFPAFARLRGGLSLS